MSKTLLTAVCAIALLAACSPSGDTITVVSWNVGVLSKYQQSSLPDVAALILGSRADAVCLNELDSCNRRHNSYQIRDLADSLGSWPFYFASAFAFAGGAYGNGIVSREPILRRSRIALPAFDGAEPRSCAVIETKRFVLGATHLDHKGDTARSSQARIITSWFTDHYAGYDKPVFLCGDFNSLPDSNVLEQLSKDWDLLSGTTPTYPSDGPVRCIDYIFALRTATPVRILSASPDTTCRTASDHLPVKVVVKCN